MRKNKKISLLVATMLVAMAFTGCGEKEKETKETVAVETTTAEQAEATGAEGETQEVSDDVFADIFDDVEINGKQVTFPFSLNDLGDEYTIDEEPFAVLEESGLETYDLYYNGEVIAYVDYAIETDEISRNTKIIGYDAVFDSGNIKIRGIGIGDISEKVAVEISELSTLNTWKDGENICGGFVLGNKKNYIVIDTENDKITGISIRSEAE